MKKKNNHSPIQSPLESPSLTARNFIETSRQLDIPGICQSIFVSELVYQRLFGNSIDDDICINPEIPCQEVAIKLSEAAIVIATAIAATERGFPVCVEIPAVEGAIEQRTKVKVFAYQENFAEEGYLILLDDEPDPSELEFAEFERDFLPYDFIDYWEDI